jgi:AcrR family transcriptional regulator
MTTPRVQAGRPRDADATARVLNATLRLLDERGFAALRIDDVARISGVAKTTIYRRWPSLAALVVTAMESALGPRPLPETGDAEADLLTLIRVVHQSISHTPFVRALPLISVELMQHPNLARQYRARIIDPVRNHAIHLIRAGQRQGRFRADVDPSLVVDAVISPAIYRPVVLHQDVSLQDLLTVGDMIFRSIRT